MPRQDVAGVVAFQASGLISCHCFKVITAGSALATPLFDVVARGTLARLHRGSIDRHLEPPVEHDLVDEPPVPGHDLGGDVAQPENRQRGRHQAAPSSPGCTGEEGPATAASASRAGPRSPYPTRRRSNRSPRRRAPRRASAVSAASSVWARYTTRV